jgi:hypothetical protein
VAPAQSKRQSRKRRRPHQTTQDEITPERIQAEIARQRAARQARQAEPQRPRRTQGALATTLTGKTYGDPPPNPFGGVPVAEIAILAGAVATFVGLLSAEAAVLLIGIVICTLGVVEFTAREHFSGYRSHTVLLAAIPAVVAGIVLIALDSASLTREVLLPAVVAVFAVFFFPLRKRFLRARQARVTQPPVP